MGKPILALFSLPALLVASRLRAADWRHVGGTTTRSAGRAVGFIDAQSIRRVGGRVTFWQFVAFERPVDGMDNTRILSEADCDTHSYRNLQSTAYMGELSIGSDGPEAIESAAAPGTVIYVSIDIACGRHGMSDATVDDPYGQSRSYFRSTANR
jgi:hypothetical protein